MTHFLMLLVGIMGGSVCTFVLLDASRRKAIAAARESKEQTARLREAREALRASEREMLQRLEAQRCDIELQKEQLEIQRRGQLRELERKSEELQIEYTARLQQLEQEEQIRKAEHLTRVGEFNRQVEALNNQVVSYKELRDENAILKRDLQNLDVSLRKLELDGEQQRARQDALDQKCTELGTRLLKDSVKWIGSSLTPNNFVNSKQRLLSVIGQCRDVGLDIPAQREDDLLSDLKAEYEKVVRAALEREEQARIKAQIREEQMLQREVERELKQLDRERAAIQVALDKALADAKNQHTAEVERLQARLAEAEARSQRAISQAQMTKAGHVYVISNIGSFGKDVFKIGMTRRLEPKDRIRELGDASVPFPFDVHMMISANDAPTLENALHRALHLQRINRINPRKEFFKVDIEEIRRIVETNHGEVQYVADAEALEYYQSLTASDEDQEFIDSVFDEAEEESQPTTLED